MGERQRVTERDQIGRPLRCHDPGHLSRRERVAFRQLAQAPRRLGRHPHLGACDRPPPQGLLAADVDHPHRPRLVHVRELAHAVNRTAG